MKYTVRILAFRGLDMKEIESLTSKAANDTDAKTNGIALANQKRLASGWDNQYQVGVAIRPTDGRKIEWFWKAAV